MENKPKLRYTSKGWLRYWLTMEVGATDFRTGVRSPDHRGFFQNEIWVGPFATIEDAYHVALR
jgi:hypothetical protein